jgi:hypothetical protein
MHRARYPGAALYRRFVSLLPVPQTTPLECPLIHVSSLVFLLNPCRPCHKVAGTLDEAGDPRLWFRVAGRLSTVPPY